MLLTKSASNLRMRTGGEREGQAEEASMIGQAETHTSSVASRRIDLPACPKCNDLVFAPAASEFVSRSHVRHFWCCETCGHEFSTSVKLELAC
jgi:uncharacterized protein with PIN domain